MAATGRTLSPGGALLRASRMFSLPTAIPAPPGDFQAATNYNSDTATAAFPTLQSVTVPENFRQRGDWGFKRNFPLRSTANTGAPYLRVKEVDSLEQVTDFDSASDHTVTLQKWQEMNVAISLPHEFNQFASGPPVGRLESVFEEKYDFTAIDDAEKIGKAGDKRWKFKGPWLANLTQGEFQTYVKREVRGRRAEFREFLRKELAPKLTLQATQRAMDEGLDQAVPDVRPEDITEEQLLDEMRVLRENRQKLYDHVEKFLDLAPLEPSLDHDRLSYAPGVVTRLDKQSPYAKSGPPVTHPSAGLSYLRTDAFLENHPVYGPQAKKKPVKGRLMINSARQRPTTGVGGFISTSPVKAFQGAQQERTDFKAPGGTKAWVNIVSAQISSNGRPVLNVESADGSARMVQEEMEGNLQVYHQKVENIVEKAMELRGPKSSSKIRGNYAFKNSTSASYGINSTQW
ncbi:mitochondrial ribosomal protein MRP51 [Coniella lustricola]|uniref:Mitochondrial ribosomal protein MRP51 n=1 Tax=Coniella lustricola TaxID=2025994 RepID=A0A2T3AJH7_9PEZI|nr:mitochondrial ribosomal protein MRP51 [Coniella lustricola]